MPKGAGIVDEDIEPAEIRRRLVDQLLDSLRVGAIGLDRNAAAAFGLDLVDDLLRAVSGSLLADRDVHAFVRQGQRDRRADATGAARHQGTLAN